MNQNQEDNLSLSDTIHAACVKTRKKDTQNLAENHCQEFNDATRRTGTRSRTSISGEK